MKKLKKEGNSYLLSDATDEQVVLEVSNDINNKDKINKEDDFEAFKKLYADSIESLKTIYGNLFPDLEGADDIDKALKDAFSKSKNYIPSEEMKPSGELDDKLKVEESVKITESDAEDLDEAFYEKVCRAYIDTMNLEWVTTNPENNNSVVHGYFINDEQANEFKGKINPENFKDIINADETAETINDTDYYEYDTWEDFYEEYVKDNIAYDITDIGLYGPNGYDFYVSKEDLEKLGFDISDILEENDKSCMTENLKDSEKEIANKFGITDNLNKLTNDLMNLEYVTNVEYDLDGYYDNMNAPITLVSFDINVKDKEYDITNYLSAKTQLIKQILAVMKNNGVNVEVKEFEDNDTYFYIVAYSTNWNTEKKTEGSESIPTKEQLYDELSTVLTDYETGPHPSASKLYDMLVKIQNNWEQVITAEE